MPRAVFNPARLAGVAVILIALAAVAAAVGAAMHALQQAAVTVAGVLLLAGSAGGAALLVWRRYAGPATRAARLLADTVEAVDDGQPAALPLDDLAAQVRERLTHFERSHRRLQAVIRDLPHGVLVFDGDAALLEINRTGTQMLGAGAQAGSGAGGPDAARGRGRGAERHAGGGGGADAEAELVERHRLADVAQRAMRGEEKEADIPVHGAETRWLQAHGRPSTTGADGERGALVVLHDVTRLRHLEQVRRDFVDNVSHELRTPFTLVSGFAETLMDGDMCPNPEARHFLEIIHKHSARVSAIIDDLLLLADIERSEDRSGISFEDSLLAPVVSAALLSCGRTAERVGVALHEVCDAGLTCRMNALLVEQAITNLVDNAIRYSRRGSGVTVRGLRRGGGVEIEVVDTGLGIAHEHQQRIFERFYRVDAARSRDSGGTGLGLAIVKHIAQAHAGEVTVRSAPGRGSTFTLRLPE